MRTLRGFSRIAALLLGQGAALAALWRLGEAGWLQVPWHDLERWLVITPVEQVAVALLRVAGLGVAGWLLLGTAVYALAAALRVPSALNGVRWMALPAVRRVVDRGLALALAGAVVATPGVALAADLESPPPAASADPGEPSPPPPPPGAPRPPDPEPSEPPPDPPPERKPPAEDEAAAEVEPPDDESAADEPDDEVPAAPATHVVQPGESLWSIARDHTPSDDQGRVAQAWVALMAANPDLPSGDTDLIHPGLQLRLPPPNDPVGG